jgi:hypothetical protein
MPARFRETQINTERAWLSNAPGKQGLTSHSIPEPGLTLEHQEVTFCVLPTYH